MTTQTPVWFITGASGGFGKAIALDALSRGHKVIATARSASRLSDLSEKGALTLSVDVTSPLAELESIAKTVYEKYGYINHVVNAAGYVLVGAVEETR
jgi:NADP-dependent 3-hydroxy acid dehydrogenase YdfG